jgi:hypothetical protein
MPINSDAYSRIMFERILETIPSLVKQEILTDSNMVRKWGVGVLTGMRLGTDGPGFERSTLYNAFRSIVDGPVLSVNLIDDEGRSWTVTVDRDDNGMLGFKVINGAVVYRLEDHSPLARDPTIRIAWLDRIADDLLPPSDWVANWRLELAATPLSDAAFVNLLEDVELMPSSVDRVIRAGLERRRADFHLFAPNKALYYNRLVGKLGTETTAAAYIDEVAGPMVEELVRRDGAAGIRRAFLVCGHGMIVARLPLASMAVDEVREVYEWLAVRGDPISRVAGVELWLANIAEYPGLEETVIRIVEAVLAEDDGEASPYAALSAVFSSSMGVMARQHLFEDAPPSSVVRPLWPMRPS